MLSTMVVDGEDDDDDDDYDDDEMRTIKGFQGSSQISPLSSVYYRRGGPLPSARRRRRRRTHPSAPVLSERASKMMTMLTKMILMLIIILVTYHQLPVAPVKGSPEAQALQDPCLTRKPQDPWLALETLVWLQKPLSGSHQRRGLTHFMLP